MNLAIDWAVVLVVGVSVSAVALFFWWFEKLTTKLHKQWFRR